MKLYETIIGYIITIAPIFLFVVIVRRYAKGGPCRGCPLADNEWVNCDKRTCWVYKKWSEYHGSNQKETVKLIATVLLAVLVIMVLVLSGGDLPWM